MDLLRDNQKYNEAMALRNQQIATYHQQVALAFIYVDLSVLVNQIMPTL
jgi:hypothetical protein